MWRHKCICWIWRKNIWSMSSFKKSRRFHSFQHKTFKSTQWQAVVPVKIHFCHLGVLPEYLRPGPRKKIITKWNRRTANRICCVYFTLHTIHDWATSSMCFPSHLLPASVSKKHQFCRWKQRFQMYPPYGAFSTKCGFSWCGYSVKRRRRVHARPNLTNTGVFSEEPVFV